MRVLVVGAGGREHALIWKIAQSPLVEKVYSIPGSDAFEPLAEVVEIADHSIETIAKWAEENRIDLTIVGPEIYLTLGITDAFAQRGLTVFGPSRAAARLEGSKVFAKEFMSKYRIPTAEYQVFDCYEKAVSYIRSQSRPLVVKADGLAAGKGVVVAETSKEAEEAAKKIMVERIFGESGARVVIEECLYGEEATLLAITDGRTIIPLLPAQDHKRIFEGDKGPNTGGMGAYCPASLLTPSLLREVTETILKPVIKGMAAEGSPYTGILYTGLMLTTNGPKVVEFNVRFGDPETQVIIPLLRTDLVELISAAHEGRLSEVEPVWEEKAAACVVLASSGYPGSYQTGQEISGIEKAEALKDLLIFHAGSKRQEGIWRTAGGRVLNLVGLGPDLAGALDRVYQAARLVRFTGSYYRRDIGWRELARQQERPSNKQS